MRFCPTALSGVYRVEPEPHADNRGLFARTFCARTFGEHGLETTFLQGSVSYNERRGTLRGLHWQASPAAETKLVRCTAGAIYDVVVDIRPESPTFRQWIACELTAGNRHQLYIPVGCAHGFQTLCDGTEVTYWISAVYQPELARGARWDDPAFGVAWPLGEPIMSERDRGFPGYGVAEG